MKIKNSFTWKIVLIGVLSLLLLIPLEMVKGLVRERQNNADASTREVADSWGRAQTLSGPRLDFSYETVETDDSGKKKAVRKTQSVYPETLSMDIDAKTQLLHRSIYDIMVYNSDVRVTGDFIIPAEFADLGGETVLAMGVMDLRGIVGDARFKLGGTEGSFSESAEKEMLQPLSIPRGIQDGNTRIPFELTFQVKGSESLMFKPFGNVTEVNMKSDCPDPSFTGDFLPTSREISPDGFTAKWVVSRINRGKPEETVFGVDLLQPLTQYRQTTRTAKYGILIILLVFIAGLVTELAGKKEIHLVQYLVIGLSLVLFYALVLSFSEFLSFGKAYALSAVMTTAALTLYFRGILKSKAAWVLGALIALAYALCYVLLQMKTYALLFGTLLLFALLCIVMYFTRNIQTTHNQE